MSIDDPAFAARVERPGRDSPSLTSAGFLLHLAQARLREGVRRAIEGSGLNGPQLAVLGALKDRGPMSQRRLGEQTQIEKSSMVQLVDALEAGGWVRRTPDPSDRRANVVQLTPEGDRKFTDLGPRLEAAQEQFLEPLSQPEREALADMLTRLARNAND